MNWASIDRRIIFLFVLCALTIPLVLGYSLTPARMDSAERLYEAIDTLEVKPGEIAFVGLDYGPNTIAENGSQAEVVVEHLMRKRVPVAFFSLYALAEPFLNSVPEGVARRLSLEKPGEKWEYGKDWVNLGYNPGGALILQAIPKSENLVELFKKDARGNSLSDIPLFREVKRLEKIRFLGEFTGLTGVFSPYVQFFKNRDYHPIFGHGCTSITIPEAFIYLDSGQLQGLLEGIAGAAWYSELLNRKNPGRKPDSSAVINTGLGVAHLIIILLIVIGNVGSFIMSRKRA